MLSRISVIRRLPKPTVILRHYTTGRSEGSVAQSKGFNKKERAHEDEYIHRNEMQLLKKLRDQIETKQAELADLEKQHQEELTKTAGKK